MIFGATSYISRSDDGAAGANCALFVTKPVGASALQDECFGRANSVYVGTATSHE